MTPNKDIANNNERRQIRTALQAFQLKPLREAAIALLNAMGYRSDKTAEIPDSNPQSFLDWLSEHNKDTEFKKNKALFDDWLKADILFQLTDEELGLACAISLLKDDDFEASQIQSYLFFAVELKQRDYARGKLATIASELNRLFPMPVMVFIKHRDLLSIVIINRHRHKLDADKDVLGQTATIQNITLNSPHQEHLDSLQSFTWSNLRKTIDNFDTLHSVWEKVFNNTELPKEQFYGNSSIRSGKLTNSGDRYGWWQWWGIFYNPDYDL